MKRRPPRAIAASAVVERVVVINASSTPRATFAVDGRRLARVLRVSRNPWWLSQRRRRQYRIASDVPCQRERQWIAPFSCLAIAQSISI